MRHISTKMLSVICMTFVWFFVAFLGRFVPAVVGKSPRLWRFSCKILIVLFQYIFEFTNEPIYSYINSTELSKSKVRYNDPALESLGTFFAPLPFSILASS